MIPEFWSRTSLEDKMNDPAQGVEKKILEKDYFKRRKEDE
jgi:hypothetical protein